MNLLESSEKGVGSGVDVYRPVQLSCSHLLCCVQGSLSGGKLCWNWQAPCLLNTREHFTFTLQTTLLQITQLSLEKMCKNHSWIYKWLIIFKKRERGKKRSIHESTYFIIKHSRSCNGSMLESKDGNGKGLETARVLQK